MEAQDDGVMAKIIVSTLNSYIRPIANANMLKAGNGSKNVQVGSTIAIIGEEGDDISGADKLAAEADEAPKQEKQEESKEESGPEAKDEKPSAPKEESKPKGESKAELAAGDRIFASPVAKKIALDRGIPLSKVKGSGPNGRILREDVEKYKPEAAAAGPVTSSGPQASLPEYTDTPISNMRRTIGSRLTQSKQELPHYYLTVDINMDKVTKLREVFNKSLAEKGAKLSVNDFILKAVSCALTDVPEANSAWLGEVIRT